MSPEKSQLLFKEPKTWAQHPEFYCEKCSNTGYSHKTVDGKDYIEECDCRIRQLKFVNFGKEFIDKTVENYEARNESMRVAKEYILKNMGNSLFIYGPVNNGKTHLMAGIYEKLMVSGKKNIKIFDDTKLEYALQPASVGEFGWKDEAGKVAKAIIGEAQVVMLMDMGKPKKGIDVNVLLKFFDRLFTQKAHLFIDSNYTIEELGKIYSTAIASRIERMCDLVPIKDLNEMF